VQDRSRFTTTPATYSPSVGYDISVRPESQDIRNLIRDFADWTEAEFQRAAHAAEAEGHDAESLVSLLAPWVEQLRECGVRGVLRRISEDDAARLRDLLNLVLDRVERQALRCNERMADMLANLPAVEDILVFLALACKGSNEEERKND
jgi:hypothetical protein